MNFIVGKGSSEQVLNEFFRHGVLLPCAVGHGDGFASAGGDVNRFHRSTSLGELEAHEHQGGLAGTLIPSGDINEKVPSCTGHRGVVAVDDGWEGQNVIVVVEDHGEAVHAVQQVGVIHALWVVQQDVGDAHRLLFGEGDEGTVAVHRHHTERRGDGAEVMDANGGALSPPAQSEMQFFLVVHQ